MLRLKRIELQGFKSFCDRTELRFHGDGIAAIVGPNGCGKSNISDAISWVLGEQSAKSLRGSRMEDVIFAGTRDRKPVGLAYVTMTLVDPEAHDQAKAHKIQVVENGQPPAPKTPGEITITRRLYRSGESEYLIDGHTARLRDIQDLFMGTGLGPESYAIIEQGRIGQILSSKPQDRRAVVEEAAGITRFKTKKRLAEAKLESARQNLARVYDILEEVTRQVNSLKRQAAKTRRYGELKAEFEGRLRVVLSGKYRLLERDAAKTAIDLNLAATELKALTQQVAEKEEAHERAQASCYRLEQELTGARQSLSEANIEAERTRGRLEAQVRESAAIEQRIAHAEKESQGLDGRLQTVGQEATVHQNNVQALEKQIAQARGRMTEINQQREALQNEVRQREQAIEAGRQVVLRLLGEASTLNNQLAQVEEYLAAIERETARTEREEQTAAAEMERLEAASRTLSETVRQRQFELESVVAEKQRTEQDLASRRKAVSDARHEIDSLKSEVSAIRARKESLEQVLAHRTYTTESVKRLFASLEKRQASNQDQDVRLLGVLADYVEVDPQFEKPAEEFLHEELEYVVVENWDQAERGLNFLRASTDGRATFLVHPEPHTNGHYQLPEPSVNPEAGVAARLSDSLRLTNGFRDSAAALLPRVSKCFLAEDRAAAQRLAVDYPHLYFLLPDGVCYQGHTVTGGRKSGAGPLAMKREARELTVALAQRRDALDRKLAELENLNREISGIEAELERLRGLQQSREKDRVALDHEMRKLTDDRTRANSRISVARLELERLRRDAAKSIEQREKNQAAVAEKERLRAEREQVLETQRQELEELQARGASIGEEHAAVRAELAGFEERHRAERASVGRLEQQFREITARRREIGAEIDRLGELRARLLADNVELDRKAVALGERILELEARVNEMATADAAHREALRASDEELKSLRSGLEERHVRRSEIEVDLVRKQAELKYLDETSRKELNCPVEELAPADDPLPESNRIAEAEQAAQELRNRIEALGAVNPAAMEEFEEAQQRHEFLSAQRQDLIDSIRDTEKAIQEIDQVSRNRFAEAFEAINNNFRSAFQKLFCGGSGEMRLTDQENIAESGIDIICSPPGKRLQNVLLLSGGEKALSAVALLMAIFKYQPSPFCVMDEVDAPLDESNIARLCTMIQEMSTESQFVMITHSKRTMEAAQALYGVTMQEPGVSRLVSVRFGAVAEAAA